MKGDVTIGHLEDHSRARLWTRDLLKSMLVCGILGSGKTNLIMSIAIQLMLLGVNVWWIDQSKSDGLFLARLFPHMQYFKPNYNFFYNPFQHSQGRTQKEVIIDVIEQFCRDMHLLLGSEAYLTRKVNETIERFRQMGCNQAVTFQDVFETVDNDFYRSRRMSDYQTATAGRIHFVLNSIGDTLACHQGFDIMKLAMGSFVLDLVGYPADVQRFIIANLIKSLINTRRSMGLLTNDLEVFVIFDEANRLFPRNEEHNPIESLPVLSQISQTAREYGVGLLGATQTPSFMANSGLKSQSWIKAIIGSLGSNEDYYDIGNIMAMTAEQIDWLKTHSEVGKAIIKIAGGEVTEPFIVRVPFLNIKEIDQ